MRTYIFCFTHGTIRTRFVVQEKSFRDAVKLARLFKNEELVNTNLKKVENSL